MLKRDVITALANGTILFANVSGKRVAVRVIRQTERTAFGTRSGANRSMVKFECKRCDNGKVLPKHRSAQSLHCTDGRRGEWGGMTEPQDSPDLRPDVPIAERADPKAIDLLIEGIRDASDIRERADAQYAGHRRARAVTPQVPALDGMTPLGASVCGRWVDGVWIDGDPKVGS